MKYSLNNITESFMGKIKKRHEETLTGRVTNSLTDSINRINWDCSELGLYIERKFNSGRTISYGNASQITFVFSKQLFLDFEKESNYYKPYTFNEFQYFKNAKVAYNENNCFTDCFLSECTLPPSWTSVPDHMFESFNYIEHVHYSDRMEVFEASCFKDCGKLSEINIPDTVQSFEGNCFNGTNITSLIVPEGITDIPEGFCFRCKRLKTLKLPSTIRSSGDKAFEDIGVDHFVIPKGMTVIPTDFLSNCNNITEIDIPKNITKVENEGFSFCRNLRMVTVHSKIEFGRNVFSGEKPDNRTITQINFDVTAPKELEDYYSKWNSKLKFMIDVKKVFYV